MNSKLIKLERRIGAIADQMLGKMKRSAVFRQNGLTTLRFAELREFAKLAKRDLAAVAALYRDWGIAIAVFCRDCGIAIVAFCRNSGTATAAFCRDHTVAIAVYCRNRGIATAVFCRDRAIAIAAFCRNRGTAIAAFCRDRTIAIAAFCRNRGTATAAFCRDRTIAIAAFCRNRGTATAAFCRSRRISIAASIRGSGIAIAAWIQKLIDAATRGLSVSANARSKRPISVLKSPASPKRRVSGNLGNVTFVLVSACLGLVVVCAVFGVVLIAQFRALKTDMAKKDYELATMKAKVNQLEKVARQIDTEQSEAASNRSVPKAQLKQPPLILDDADVKLVHQFIKVPPPKLGVQAKLSVGDDIAHLTASPIPTELADALPKLRGASFSIDQDGSIIIISAGSNRINAVIAYH